MFDNYLEKKKKKHIKSKKIVKVKKKYMRDPLASWEQLTCRGFIGLQTLQWDGGYSFVTNTTSKLLVRCTDNFVIFYVRQFWIMFYIYYKEKIN